MSLDIERVSSLLREAAAEEALPRFRALGEDEVLRKKAGDLVTVADLAVEKFLSRRLAELRPGSLVVGEEAVEHDPAILDRLAGQDSVWIIDPIDGTGNFAHGRPLFAIMVALTQGGRTLAGWIYDPIRDRMAVAERGEGAWLDGSRLAVARNKPLDELCGTLHFGMFAGPDIARHLERRRERVLTQRSLRCAGQEYLRLVTGESDFALFTKTKPWDHCAGTLLFNEAGGTGRLLDGREYTARDHSERGLLLAPHEEAWRSLYQTLFGADAAS